MSALKPEPSFAATYIRENFEPQDRLAIVVLKRRTNSVAQRIAMAQTIIEPDFQSWLCARNDRDRCEIYISMNVLHPDAQGRTKHDVAAIRHLYLDFDENGTAAVERLLKRPDVPKPNHLISTSPEKWQVVWKVEGFSKDEAEQFQRGLARDAEADPAATDCARVLRLPGYLNHKYAQPYLIQARSLSGQTYRPDQFPRISMDDRLSSVGERRAARPRSGSLSQSERDWAYAKRALARGDSPALVVAAIASHRHLDKPNPQYYAELTVRKAQDALQLEANRFQAPQRR